MIAHNLPGKVPGGLPFLNHIRRWVAEPPPDHFFEITENSLSGASRNSAAPVIEMLMEPGLTAAPGAPNVLNSELYRNALTKISGPGETKQTRTALVIPDYAVRMAILDFEEFPAAEEQRIALLRFRLRKSVPFHIEQAHLSYSLQLQDHARVEVLVIAIAAPILKEYELLFTQAGFRVGMVTPSSIAALALCENPVDGLTLLAKVAGWTLSLFLLEHKRVRLIRCLDLADARKDLLGPDREMVLPLLQQTLAYAEDHIGIPVKQLLLSGFGLETDALGKDAEEQMGLRYAEVKARCGATLQENTGLLGLMEQYLV